MRLEWRENAIRIEHIIGQHRPLAIVAALAAVCVTAGWLAGQPQLIGSGALAICLVSSKCHWLSAPSPSRVTAKPVRRPVTRPTGDASDVTSLVDEMLEQRRYALLMRPELMANLSPDQQQQTRERLDQAMALVPAGNLLMGVDTDGTDMPPSTLLDEPGMLVHVDAFYLDRFPVTNRQFYEFVSAGGYEQLAIWNPEILPGVLDFVDQTGTPGPRFWRDGCYLPDSESHPVVGLSWYEADAYARWAGKRLATDPEWEKAGSWPVQLSASKRPQRRFPWGDAMDYARANLWGSGKGATVPVDTMMEGASVGGIYHLVGNVWEWTSGGFGSWGCGTRELLLSIAMKSIRGGAFDTYFDNQATCQFSSGEDPLARRHNIGFRCALSFCDVVGTPAHDELTAAEGQPTSAEDPQ